MKFIIGDKVQFRKHTGIKHTGVVVAIIKAGYEPRVDKFLDKGYRCVFEGFCSVRNEDSYIILVGNNKLYHPWTNTIKFVDDKNV